MRISDWSSDVCSSDLWYWFVLPALMLNYLGQGALVLEDPTAIRNPFYIGVPDWARLPMIILATAATVIASQAVITGAFSVTRQAMQLGYIPRMLIRHTSRAAIGQIYIPGVNWAKLGREACRERGWQDV